MIAHFANPLYEVRLLGDNTYHRAEKIRERAHAGICRLADDMSTNEIGCESNCIAFWLYQIAMKPSGAKITPTTPGDVRYCKTAIEIASEIIRSVRAELETA